MSKWGFLAVFSLGFLAYAGMNVFFKETNTLEFCTSCHTMEQNLIEYKETAHYKNHSGVRATCADCHVPKAPLAKIWTKLYAAKDVYHEIIGTIDTPEKFESHRWEMANRVWDKMKESDSRECRTCHSWEAMMFSEQDKSASKKHQKAKKEGQTCIDCHKGVAHEEPDDPADQEPATPKEEKGKTVTDDSSEMQEKPAMKSAETTKLATGKPEGAVTKAPEAIAPAQTKESKSEEQGSDAPKEVTSASADVQEPSSVSIESAKPEEETTPVEETKVTKSINESSDSSPQKSAKSTDTPQLGVVSPSAHVASTDATDAGPLTDLVNGCNKCHGKDGNSQDTTVPNISKASALYLHDALIAFKSGDRKGDEYKSSDGQVTDMNKVVADLTEEQFTALGEYYAGKSFVAHSQDVDSVMASAGKKIFDKKCEKCHAEGGTDPEDDAGIIAGQPKDYLVKQFAHFDDESRDMPKKMAKKFKKLTAEEKQKVIEFLIQ